MSSGSHTRRSHSRQDYHQSSSRHRKDRSPRRSRSPSKKKEEWRGPYIHDNYDPIMAGSIDGTDTVPHDKAVIRAVTSEYRPNKGVTGVKRRSIFMGRLPVDSGEADIQSVMEKYGDVVECKVVRDLVTGISRRYAFVEFVSSHQAKRVLEESARIEINGSQVVIEPVYSGELSGWKPRRLGGGLGGWKESGQLRFGGRARPFRKPLTMSAAADKSKHSSFTQRRNQY